MLLKLVIVVGVDVDVNVCGCVNMLCDVVGFVLVVVAVGVVAAIL